MNERQALAKARRLWGRHAAVRDSGKPSGPEQRAAAKEARAQFLALPADRRPTDFAKQRDRLAWESGCYRCSVGAVELGLFFAVKGQGDNFEEAFEDAERHGR
jgi:hypothetical protein